MDASKDYYAILGVLPSVDAAVLQAVYRALAKKYHPDAAHGAGHGAGPDTAAFIELQEAYNVLRDPLSRRRYDELRQARHEHAGRFDQASDSCAPEENAAEDQDEAWEIIREYEPIVASEERRLRKLSASLALVFRSSIMNSRDFRSAELIAEKLEEEFLSTYFGDSVEIQEFARRLLSLDDNIKGRDAARELNRVIRTLQNPSDPEVVMRRISQKFGLEAGPPKPIRPLPDNKSGWNTVIKAAASMGWQYSGGGLTARPRFSNAKLKVWFTPRTPDEAWDQMGLDGS